MKICFFAKVDDRQLLEDVAYYSEDLAILRELGHDVYIATKFSEVPWDCDLYFTWWYAWGFVTLCKSLISRKPNVMIGPVHLYDPEVGFYKRRIVRQWSIRLSLQLADAAVAVSKLEYKGIKALGARRPWMVYHSIEAPAAVQPLEQRDRLILSLGHLDGFGIQRKRFDNVVRAVPLVLQRFPDIKFAIVGRKGPGFDILPQLASQLHVEQHVEFPGRVDEQTKNDYLRRALILAQPTCYEGFGVAQMEAIAHGVPVVTSDAGAVAEVVGDAGLYCDKDSPPDIARKIIQLLEDKAAWSKLSSIGRTRALTLFSRQERKNHIDEILNNVVAKRSKASRLPRKIAAGTDTL